jgi:hypothetical protein
MQQDAYTEEEAWRQYRRMLGRSASRGMARKAEKGDLPGCAPVGYRNVRDGEKCWIELDERMAPLVRRVFQLAAEGDTSLRKILQIVTNEGLCSRNGKPLSVSSLHAMLNNPFYTGMLRYGGGLLPGNHPAIVDKFLFEQVQAALERRQRRR